MTVFKHIFCNYCDYISLLFSAVKLDVIREKCVSRYGDNDAVVLPWEELEGWLVQ
jgi:hypothetical protein